MKIKKEPYFPPKEAGLITSPEQLVQPDDPRLSNPRSHYTCECGRTINAAQIMGKTTTQKKADAARANGLKGGRPKKAKASTQKPHPRPRP